MRFSLILFLLLCYNTTYAQHDTTVHAGRRVWIREIPGGREMGFGKLKDSVLLHDNNPSFKKINKVLEDASTFNAQVDLKVNETKEILGVTLTDGLQDTLIYLAADSLDMFYIGIYIDYDEAELIYDMKSDSAVSNAHLVLYDRWGNVIVETKTFSPEFHRPPTGSFYWVFDYEYEGVKKNVHGVLENKFF